MDVNPNLYILTGGPGSGKTSVLDELHKLGYTCVPEVARQIIQEQVRTGGIALPWQDSEAYTKLMLERSIESYRDHTPAAKPTFADRGIPDTLAYARLINLAAQDSIEEACRQYRYATRVFVAPPWKEIYQTDAERKQDFPEAERTFQEILDTYKSCGYDLLILPKTPAGHRASFILEAL